MKVLYGISKGGVIKPTVVEWEEEIIVNTTRQMAIKQAEKREMELMGFASKHGFKKLFFGRWLFVFCDMKNMKFKESYDLK